MAQACHLSICEAEVGELLSVQGLPGLYGDPQVTLASAQNRATKQT